MTTRKNDGIYDAYLAHHGTLGMKWGHRRYQNEDGSYKPGAEGRYYTPTKRDQKNLYKHLKRTRRGTSSNTIITKDSYLDEQLDKVMTDTNKKELVELLKAKDEASTNAENINDKYLDVDHPKYQEAIAKYNEINGKYNQKVESYVDTVLGNYGKKNVRYLDKSAYKAKNIVNAYIQNKTIDVAYKEQRIEKQLENAKNNDSYDLTFLEIVQNKKVLGQGGKKLLNEYRKYLNDPEGYWDEADKLEDE